jgi:Xaa-Pro aminopeptidase
MTGGLMPMDVAGRADRVREALVAAEVDALVVTRLTNLRWLTGFTGSNGVAVLTAGRLTVITDGRYTDQAGEQLAAAGVTAEVVIDVDVLGQVPAVVGSAPARIGLEADDISWAAQARLAESISGLVATQGLILALRAVKDPGEVARIEAACGIADRALAEVVALLGNGATEAEVGAAFDAAVRRHGGSGVSFETIVASGPNGALPHARPTDRRIRSGDLVVIDCGALVDGYHSDMTRTFAVGEPAPEQRRQLEVVLAAHDAGVAAMAAGVPTKDVDAAARAVIADAGWADHFTHGTGHGVGLDIHELPRVSARSDEILATGMVATVEPGVYLPGVAGVRWEDSVLITADGPRRLTAHPKSAVV